MLVIALVAVCLATFQQSPTFGVPLGLGSTLSLIRTFRVSRRRRRDARPLSTAAAVSVFLASLARIAVAAWSALMAFCLTCFPIGASLFRIGGLGIAFAIGIGLAAALFVLSLFWRIDLGDGP